MNDALSNIATNVITGFLGVGKTTAILNWLKNKPDNERWSVLVNEAGQVGVDGKVMQDAGIVVKQVPGGCMCCASGLPMQVAVNQLLITTRPHRLLIEPSGMGHPRNILKTLSAIEYQGVLDLRACLCLIDPRHLSDQRYLNSELFMDQIAVADVLVANKGDLCTQADKQHFDDFVQARGNKIQANGWTSQGQLEPMWMGLKHRPSNEPVWIKVNKAEAMELTTLSMELPNDLIVELQQFRQFLDSLDVERLKAIVHTDQGAVFVNHVNGQTTVSPVNECDSYRIEVVSEQAIDEQFLQEGIDGCLVQ